MNISKVANLTGISAKMIRYYEEINLIPKPARSNAGYREYQLKDIERLKFIAQSRQLGFNLEEVKTLLELWQNQHRQSADVKALAEQHLQQLQEKISQLQNMSTHLQHMIQCCAGNEQPECAILNSINDLK